MQHVGRRAGSLGLPLGIRGAHQELFEHDAACKRVVRVGDSVFIPDVNVPDRYLKSSDSSGDCCENCIRRPAFIAEKEMNLSAW